MQALLSILVAGILVGILVYVSRKHAAVEDAVIPAPAVLRTDLLYGYYGCVGDQVKQTLDHTNLLWESQFDGWQATIANILLAQQPTVLDVIEDVFVKIAATGKNYAVSPDAEDRLRALFAALSSAGALKYVKWLYPMDEPNTNAATPQDLLQGIMTTRKVAAEFPELAGVKLACIYAAKPESFTCIEQFDLVGVDDYDRKSQVLVNGTYAALVKAKRPDAMTILLPGGGFGQDPTPFVNFAHSHAEVAAVVPFVWFGPREPADTWVGIGDVANPRKAQYIEAGQALTRH